MGMVFHYRVLVCQINVIMHQVYRQQIKWYLDLATVANLPCLGTPNDCSIINIYYTPYGQIHVLLKEVMCRHALDRNSPKLNDNEP